MQEEKGCFLTKRKQPLTKLTYMMFTIKFPQTKDINISLKINHTPFKAASY